MITCPYCQQDLGDLTPVMDTLSKDKLNGEVHFDATCCGKPLRAYSNVMAYYLEAAKPLANGQENTPILIGHA